MMRTDYSKVKRNNLDAMKPEGFKMEDKSIPVEVKPEVVDKFNKEYDKAIPKKDDKNYTPYDPGQKELHVMMVCNCKFVNVRKSPNKKSDVLQILEVRQAVSTMPHFTSPDAESWEKVRTSNGIKGYIMSKFLREATV